VADKAYPHTSPNPLFLDLFLKLMSS